MSAPHDTWADQYDAIYASTFGTFYEAFTERTLAEVERLMGSPVALAGPPARVVDFGAGTGRLAIPLALRGYRVTAVEPSREMARVLREKATLARARVETVVETMAGFAGAEFDLALCVFTVIAYVVDEEGLAASFRGMARALTPGGRLLLDIPTRGVFSSHQRRAEGFERTVSVTPLGEDLYTYEESTRVRTPGGEAVEVHDRFPIRYWSEATVFRHAESAGLGFERDLSDAFSGTGSRYVVLRRGG